MATTPSFSHAECLDPVSSINAPARPDPALFARAVLFGIAGMFAGAVLDGGFIGLTHIDIGFLAIAVAWLVAKAMITGSNGQGGRTYQICALLLTYLSVSLAQAGLVYFALRQEGGVPLNLHNGFALIRFGLESPFLEFQHSPANAALGLFILFVGLRAAWRMTSGDPAAVRHPFAR